MYNAMYYYARLKPTILKKHEILVDYYRQGGKNRQKLSNMYATSRKGFLVGINWRQCGNKHGC